MAPPAGENILLRVAAPPAPAPQANRGRVVFDVPEGRAAVLEVTSAGTRPVCPSTPCTEDAAPGHHIYRFVPLAGALTAGPGGTVDVPAGAYSLSTDANADLAAGKTQVLRVALGQAHVRRSFPVGRGIGWAVLAAGAAVAVAGLAKVASAPSGSPDAEIGQGIAGVGGGIGLLGAVLWEGNLRDDTTVTERPGGFTVWTMP
jgi:hypothetical protein